MKRIAVALVQMVFPLIVAVRVVGALAVVAVTHNHPAERELREHTKMTPVITRVRMNCSSYAIPCCDIGGGNHHVLATEEVADGDRDGPNKRREQHRHQPPEFDLGRASPKFHDVIIRRQHRQVFLGSGCAGRSWGGAAFGWSCGLVAMARPEATIEGVILLVNRARFLCSWGVSPQGQGGY